MSDKEPKWPNIEGEAPVPKTEGSIDLSGLKTYPKEAMDQQIHDYKMFLAWYESTPPLERDKTFIKQIKEGNYKYIDDVSMIPEEDLADPTEELLNKIIEREGPVSLTGLRVIPPKLMKKILAFRNKEGEPHTSGLNFNSVTYISVEIAELMAQYVGPIDLVGLSLLPEDAEEKSRVLHALARHEGGLRLKYPISMEVERLR